MLHKVQYIRLLPAITLKFRKLTPIKTSLLNIRNRAKAKLYTIKKVVFIWRILIKIK